MADPNKTLAEQLEPMATDLAHKEREAELLAAIEYGKDLLRTSIAQHELCKMDLAISRQNINVFKQALRNIQGCWAHPFLPRNIKARIVVLLDAPL